MESDLSFIYLLLHLSQIWKHQIWFNFLQLFKKCWVNTYYDIMSSDIKFSFKFHFLFLMRNNSFFSENVKLNRSWDKRSHKKFKQLIFITSNLDVCKIISFFSLKLREILYENNYEAKNLCHSWYIKKNCHLQCLLGHPVDTVIIILQTLNLFSINQSNLEIVNISPELFIKEEGLDITPSCL